MRARSTASGLVVRPVHQLKQPNQQEAVVEEQCRAAKRASILRSADKVGARARATFDDFAFFAPQIPNFSPPAARI